MILKKKFFLLVFFFIIFSSYNFKAQKKNFSIFFPIKEITIKGSNALDIEKLKAELEFLRNTSLFFFKEEEIIKVTQKYSFISSIQLKKKYPNTLKILISEKVPVATEINGKKKYYIKKNGKKINHVELKIFEDLPLIFGKHKNFNFLFSELEKSNFKINNIKAFYYFEIGRWDIVLKNKKIIKLPKENYQNILTELNLILNNSKFSKYRVFDYRIKDQLILQ